MSTFIRQYNPFPYTTKQPEPLRDFFHKVDNKKYLSVFNSILQNSKLSCILLFNYVNFG